MQGFKFGIYLVEYGYKKSNAHQDLSNNQKGKILQKEEEYKI